MARKMNNKPWDKISADARLYFDKHADWMNHFGIDVIEEAQEYYAYGLEENEYGRLSAVESAWDYAQGASRFMQRPSAESPTSEGSTTLAPTNTEGNG